MFTNCQNFTLPTQDRVIQSGPSLDPPGVVELYGVDVRNSKYLSHPEVLTAVQYAAECHRGQYRATGEPYVTHVIETAKIVESLLPRVSGKFRAR